MPPVVTWQPVGLLWFHMGSMNIPPPPITDADAAYPETEGYEDFVRKNQAPLEKLEALRSDVETQEHMRQHVQLLEGSGHTQRWFMLRGCESEALLKPGTAEHEDLRAASRQLFLLDAACDAANHHYRMASAPMRVKTRLVDASHTHRKFHG